MRALTGQEEATVGSGETLEQQGRDLDGTSTPPPKVEAQVLQGHWECSLELEVHGTQVSALMLLTIRSEGEGGEDLLIKPLK